MLDLWKFAERNFSRTSWSGLALGLVTALVFLFATDRLLFSGNAHLQVGMQKNAVRPDERVVKVWRDRQDPRGFVQSSLLKLPENQFGLAWISSSPISIRQAPPGHRFFGRAAYELTEVMAAQVKRINGKPLWIHEYMIQGARTGDERRAVLHAASDPSVDAILMTMNPPWLFNDWLQYTKSNQRASIFAMKGSRFGDFLQGLKFVRPSWILEAKLSRYFSFVRNRYAFNRAVQKANRLPFPLMHKPEAKKSKYINLNYFYPGKYFRAPKNMEKYKGYRATLMKQTLSEKGQGSKFFKLDIQTLAESGKPVLLYISPLPKEMRTDKEGVAYMQAYANLAKKIIKKYGGPNIHIATDTAFSISDKLIHKDIVHMHYGQALVDKLETLMVTDLNLKVEKAGGPSVYESKKR